ncbi:MAG: MotA/TolQ/ExbB proton channel family protein [Lachnospiraceae bacterium]|nr:MotA/TolQ/ExbB proton channel family protein [Lachnospiraceae bacterium]
MTEVLQVVKDNINLIILIFGIVLTAFIFYNGSKLSSHKNRIDEAVSRRNKKWGVNPTDGAVVDEDDEDASVTPDTIRQYEREFNKDCALHSVLSQLIPIFPLMGILGTVAGLMLEVNAGDIEGMMASINTAMSSTFFGLVFAIFLKIVDAVFPSRVIEDVDVMLEDYSKKLDLADMIQKIKSND